MNQEFGRRIRMLYWCTELAMTETLAQMELTASQGHVMGYLCHQSQPRCARDIERHFRLSHPTVSGLLTRLEKKGFIEFYPDALDKRCKRIRVMPKGMEVHHRIAEIIRHNEQRLMEGFTEEERSQFSAFLNRAIANMDCPCQQHSEEEPQL